MARLRGEDLSGSVGMVPRTLDDFAISNIQNNDFIENELIHQSRTMSSVCQTDDDFPMQGRIVDYGQHCPPVRPPTPINQFLKQWFVSYASNLCFLP